MAAQHRSLGCPYRNADDHDEQPRVAAAVHLRTAVEALNLAVLCLETDAHHYTAVQARSFLVEAVLALGRARVYLPELRTYSVAVIMAAEPDPNTELQRLHQLATRLLWYNHSNLPARRQATPMRPEDEAQLARLVTGLARTARTGHALRHAWLGFAGLVAVLIPTFGIGAVATLMLASIVIATAVQLARTAWTAATQPARTTSY